MSGFPGVRYAGGTLGSLVRASGMSDFELAQLNIAHMVAPIDSPLLSDFVANLGRINSLAERSPGYVWRLQTEAGNATAVRPFGENYLVNLSVWKDIESLYTYVYKSGHVEIMRRRREWFERTLEAYTVLWWIPSGHRPTTTEAKAKLERLQAMGPTPDAFTFKKPFPSPELQSTTPPRGYDDTCPTP